VPLSEAPPATGFSRKRVASADVPSWGESVSLAQVANAVRRVWYRAVLCGVVAALLGVVVGLVRPKSYVAHASFVAEQTKIPSLPSGVGALAAQFGIDIGASESSRSPQFYRDLLTTSGLLQGILDSAVSVRTGESVSIRRLFDQSGDTTRAGVDRVLRRLRKRINASADARTSMVTLAVRAPTPLAAEGLATTLVSAITHFNVTTRQVQARERRRFLEGRVSEAYRTLQNAEEDLRQFYERNRRFAESPALLFEESRMKRVIDLEQELYTTLSKQLEAARIQEIDDTPTITVVDPPFASPRPSGPTVPVIAVVCFFVCACVAGAWLVAMDTARMRENSPPDSFLG